MDCQGSYSSPGSRSSISIIEPWAYSPHDALVAARWCVVLCVFVFVCVHRVVVGGSEEQWGQQPAEGVVSNMAFVRFWQLHSTGFVG